MKNRSAIELATAVMKLGGRVSATATAKVLRGRRGMVREPAIVAFGVSDEEVAGLGLLYVKDYGFSGHKVYVVA